MYVCEKRENDTILESYIKKYYLYQILKHDIFYKLH